MMIEKTEDRRGDVRDERQGRRGAALLIVLFVVMAITVLSLGFLSRSDVELAWGENMILRSQMDYLCESGLEHARGLILNPQDVAGVYWTGANGQQLVTGSSDYYNVAIVRDDPNFCNYIIDCNAYRLKGGEKVGRSSLEAELRLDPAIGLWIGTDVTITNRIIINGDLCCFGDVMNSGTINGDVFAANLFGGAAGQLYPVEQAIVTWPNLGVSDFDPSYYIDTTSYTSQNLALDDYNNISLPTSLVNNPKGVVVHDSNGVLILSGNVTINGTLVVKGDLTIKNLNNRIVARKNFPALIVSGQLRIEQSGGLRIVGLVQVESMFISDDAGDVMVRGALFVNGGISGPGMMYSGNVNIITAPDKAAIETWPSAGSAVRWSPVGGAFFKSIERK